MLRPLMLMTACTVLTHLCSLATILLLAKSLGAETYGRFVTGLTVQAYLFLVGGLGVKQVVIREGACHHEKLSRLFSANLVLTVTASLLLAGCLSGIVFWLDLDPSDRVLLVTLSVGNIALCANALALFDICSRQPLSMLLTLLVEVASLAGITAAHFLNGLTLEWAGVAFAAKWTCNTLIHYLVLNRWEGQLRFQWCADEGLVLLRSGWPLLGASLLATIPLNLGVFIVLHFHGARSTALLGLGIQAASAYALLAAVGVRLLQPRLAKPDLLTAHSLAHLVGVYVSFLFVMLLGALIVGWLAVTFALGEAFAGALIPICVLLSAAFVIGLTTLASFYLLAGGEGHWVLVANALAAVVYVGGCWLLVPSLGEEGAALMTGAAALTACAILSLRVSRIVIRLCIKHSGHERLSSSANHG